MYTYYVLLAYLYIFFISPSVNLNEELQEMRMNKIYRIVILICLFL